MGLLDYRSPERPDELLTPPALKEYEEIEATAWKEYEEIKAIAWKEYEEIKVIAFWKLFSNVKNRLKVWR